MMPPQLPFEPEEQQPGLPMEQVKGAVPVGNISQIHPGPWLDPKKTIAGNIGSAYNRLMDRAVNLSPTERQQHPVESAFGAAHNFISMTPDELKQHPYQAMGRTALKTAGDLATVYGTAAGAEELLALPELLPRMAEYGKNLMSGGVDAWKNMVGAHREARLMAGAGDATKAAVKDKLAAYIPLSGPRSVGAGAEAAAEEAPKFNVGAGKSNLIDESTSPNPEHGDSAFSKTKEDLRNDALRGKGGPKTQQAAIERGLMGEDPVFRPKEAIIQSEGPRTPAQDRAIKMAAGIDPPAVSGGSDAYAGPDRRNVDQSVLLNRRVSEPGQGGHAGGGISSEEELSRPGKHYIVKANGDLTYHGKSYAPEETPRGAAHVTVKPNGEFQVNEGTLSDAGRKALEKAVGKPSKLQQ